MFRKLQKIFKWYVGNVAVEVFHSQHKELLDEINPLESTRLCIRSKLSNTISTLLSIYRSG